MDENILILINRAQSPLFSFLSNIFSFLGEMTIVIIVLLPLYWCYSKKRAFSLVFTVFLSVISANYIKSVVRRKRPFQVLDSVEGGRLSTATGYSFPSGHAATASSFYLFLSRGTKRKAVKILFILLIISVCLSRLYFGVHWPSDVVAGAAIGLVFVCVLSPISERIWENEKVFSLFNLFGGILFLLFSIVLAFLLDGEKIDYSAYSDLTTMLSLSGAAFISFLLERKFVNFSHPENKKERVLISIIGIVLSLLVLLLCSFLPLSHKVKTVSEMTLLSFFSLFIYPLVFTRIMSSRSQKQS